MPEGRLREEVVLRGDVVFGHGVLVLTPCGGGEVYRLQDGTRGDLPEIYRSLTSGPDGPIFMEVRGLFISEPPTAAIQESEAELLVQDVIRAAREGPGCEEDLTGVDFRAMGVEPFWALDVTGGGLEFRRPDAGTRLFQVETTWESARSLRLSGRAEGGETLSVGFRYSRCVDPMSGSVFPLQAEVQIDGKTVHGCAVAGTR
jgi:putative lipoprotein